MVLRSLMIWPRFVIVIKLSQYTVDGERFAGLNFHVFYGFPGYRKSVSVNIRKCLSLIILNNEYLWPRQRENISVKTSMAFKLRIFSPANLSPSTVHAMMLLFS